MLVDEFDFELPDDLIATAPADPRDSARMLHVSAGGEISHKHIPDLLSELRAGDVLVFNNTKVIPARLHGKRDEVAIEILLHKKLPPTSTGEEGTRAKWQCFARPAKRLKLQQTISFSDDLSAIVADKLESGEVVLEFNVTDDELHQLIDNIGEIPLPPYISRPEGATSHDKDNYQTCYAKHKGSVAAPTAGLHFTPRLIEKLKDKGIKTAFVTLHVGGGTFLPVKAEDTKDHKMHSEWGEVDEETAALINEVKQNGGRIVSVGTTSLRLLESAARTIEKSDDIKYLRGQTRRGRLADNTKPAMSPRKRQHIAKAGAGAGAKTNNQLKPFRSDTDIFITPGYEFKMVDMLLTNFHLPRSTLFMLVSAFSGLETMKKAYREAIDNKYRFYSYGDACLLENKYD